jgi:transcriptional regulator with XRE-family HTH domain
MQHRIMRYVSDSPMHTHVMYRSERIRELRESRALTQTQLARMAGTTQPTISRIEKGEIEKRPDRPLAARIARALSVTLAEVFDDADEAAPAPPSAPPDPGRESGDFGSGLSIFESAALSVVDPSRHSIADLSAAAEAWKIAARVSGRAVDPGPVARLWLDAARALRVEGAAVTPTSVIARVAMGEDTENTA